ncbi:hypothetical protein BBP40_005270 [Aspergillus hancockii]|nr:hypothetical protein BBP40_005270 [Aspergillus hancockii]
MFEKETSQDTSENVNESSTEWDGALYGVRLYLGAFGLGFAVFLTAIEATIVSTSLVTITDDLGDFGRSSWVITSYLLTYTGCLMIWSKFGDIWRVKTALLASLFLFTAFSGGCGGADTLSQLIVCRAFQGIGGAGVYTLTLYSFVRIVPSRQYDTISSVAGGILSLGLVLGPLIGGAVAEKGSWRWVFLCNVPAGAFAWVLLFVAMPANFPNAPSTQADPSPYNGTGQKLKAVFRRADILGALILLVACSFAIAALQEGNYEYPWSSGLVISFLVISGLFWILFLLWEWFISKRSLSIYAMFPWRLAHNRIFLGSVLGFFTTGLPITVCIIEIPQRFQIVNNCSPLDAGIRFLAYALSSPVGIISCSVLAGRIKVPFCYIALGGIALQIIGLFLFSEVSSAVEISAAQYGYLVLAGLGIGASVSVFYMMVPLVVEGKDQSIALSTGLQLRMLGGVLGVAASSTILHNYLKDTLSEALSPEQLGGLLHSGDAIRALPPDTQTLAREAYSVAYSEMMKLAGAFSVAQLVAVAMIWKRTNVRYIKR